MNQNTLKRKYKFEGKGLHTGKMAHMTLCPASVDTGIVFHRVDLGPDAFVEALAENVSSTARSTTISKGRTKVITIEHVLSALTGLGVDNAVIEIDGPEVPILEGSAKHFAESIAADGVVEQDAERKYLEIDREFVFRNEHTGGWIKVEPSDRMQCEVTIDFDSRVLGVQTVRFDENDTDYASQIAPCRTFCFLHEIQTLLFLGLIKGGDVENAIVVVEKPVSAFRLRLMSWILKQPRLSVSEQGYLSNLVLRFPDECGRHKLLDLMGDMRLCGGFLKAKITAFKPGHRANTTIAADIRKTLTNG